MFSTLMEKVSLCGLLTLCFLVVFTKSDESDRLFNYITTATLPDGERELRMRFGNVIARETSVTQQNDQGIRRGLMLRQVASGPHLLQMIYKLNHEELPTKHRRLVECEIINDWGSANKFRTQFQKELLRAGLHLQVPANKHPLHDLDENNSTSQYFDFPQEDDVNETDGDIIDLDQEMEEFRNVTVRMLRDNEIIGDTKKAFDIHTQQKQCRRLHRRMKQIAKNNGQHSSNKDQSQRRVRREAFRVGIMPGTLWCGDGSLADKYESMGAHVGTDRCCREHDGCPFIIEALSSNYGVFNYRMHTLSHCTCDERFRSCLKQTNTGAANFVGKIFFNVVQTKCFLLKPEKGCAKLSWWGKCLKHEYKKQAHLRDPIPY